MNKSTKIAISILLGIIAILVAIIFFRPAVIENDSDATARIEAEITKLNNEVVALGTITKNRNDSIALIFQSIFRVDDFLRNLPTQKKKLATDFESDVADLNGLSMDSLKIIALKE